MEKLFFCSPIQIVQIDVNKLIKEEIWSKSFSSNTFVQAMGIIFVNLFSQNG